MISTTGLCVICNVNETKTTRSMYCSKACEAKAWRLRYPEKMLAARKKYRDTHKELIHDYGKQYKARIVKARDSIMIKLKQEHNCLRCDGDSRLEVHHIKRQDLGGGKDDTNNMVVLCKSCHALWHKYFNNDYWIAKA